MTTSAPPALGRESGVPLITSETDEALMRHNLSQTYNADVLKLGVSVEHYRYLAEQVVALRVMLKRQSEPTENKIIAAASAIANARGGRRGMPTIKNVLDMLPQKLIDEVMEDAKAALAAAMAAP